jgi:acyl-CoA thioester hydrolase
VVRTVVEYVRPIRLDDAPLRVETWACEVRAASFTLGYRLATKAGVHARATTVLAPFVFAAGRPRRLTGEESDRLRSTYGEPPIKDVRVRPAPFGGTEYHRPIQVRFSDVDVLGHVNNVRYFDYAHEAQVEVLTGVFQEARVSGTVNTVVVRSEMDHLGQMDLRPEPYDVWSRVAAVGRTSVTLESEIRDGDRVMARASVVEVNVDEDGTSSEWHERHRELFEQRLVSSRER